MMELEHDKDVETSRYILNNPLDCASVNDESRIAAANNNNNNEFFRETNYVLTAEYGWV